MCSQGIDIALGAQGAMMNSWILKFALNEDLSSSPSVLVSLLAFCKVLKGQESYPFPSVEIAFCQ